MTMVVVPQKVTDGLVQTSLNASVLVLLRVQTSMAVLGLIAHRIKTPTAPVLTCLSLALATPAPARAATWLNGECMGGQMMV